MAKKEYRVFGGKKYFVIANLYDTKVEARASAKRQKEDGNLARIVKDKHGYRVYRRRK